MTMNGPISLQVHAKLYLCNSHTVLQSTVAFQYLKPLTCFMSRNHRKTMVMENIRKLMVLRRVDGPITSATWTLNDAVSRRYTSQSKTFLKSECCFVI